jgi:thiamine-monophosphate kinase
MKVGELGEFGLLDRIARLVAAESAGTAAPSHPLLIGIGDDAAAWHTGAGIELFTTDSLVQGVHFTLETTPWRDLGWKALAVNVSDVAAMGGRPLYAVVTLGLSPELPVEAIDELYRGMFEACWAYGAAIVGGDITRSPLLFITISLTGVAEGPLLVRSAAHAGDQVAVTGPLGASAGGLRVLRQGGALAPALASSLREAHLRPRPRLKEGLTLARKGVRCAIDISDGLVADLCRLCEASGVAARLPLSKVPAHPALRQAFPKASLDLALSGGEDYELLFTAPPLLMEQVIPDLPPGAAVIGEIVPGPPGHVSLLDPEGQSVPAGPGGWDHLRP